MKSKYVVILLILLALLALAGSVSAAASQTVHHELLAVAGAKGEASGALIHPNQSDVRAEDAVTGWNSPPPTVVDSVGDVGRYLALAVVAGHPAISYFDATNGDLKYARALDATGSTWGVPAVIDDSVNFGRLDLEIISGRPAIAYFTSQPWGLRFVRALDDTGGSWTLPITIATNSTSGRPSLTTVNGRPAITFGASGISSRLMYIRALDEEGTAWGAAVVVDNAAHVAYTSMAVVDNAPAIAYWDQNSSDLRFVRGTDADGASWNPPATIDSEGMTGYWPSMVVVAGNPAIAYSTVSSPTSLKYIRAVDSVGGSWGAPAILDTHYAPWASMAIINEMPAISYSETAFDTIRFMRSWDSEGTSWRPPLVLDTAGTASEGIPTSMAVVNGQPGIAYHQGVDDSLMYVRADNPSGTRMASTLGPYLGQAGVPIYLDGTPSTGLITEYAWDCTDDGIYDVTSSSPTGSTCTYATDGSYIVRLRVTDTGDQIDEDTADVIVSPDGPATFFVNTSDDVDPPGTCDPKTDTTDCSLREAVIAANKYPSPDTIVLAPATYQLTITGAGEEAAQTGDLDITAEVVIQGAGETQTIVDGNRLDNVFDCKVRCEFNDLTIRNGTAGIVGGPLALNRTLVTNSGTGASTDDIQGGTFTANAIGIESCGTVSGVRVMDGGARCDGGEYMAVSQSYVAGGVFVTGDIWADLDVTNSTVRGDVYAWSQDGDYDSSVSLLNVTLVDGEAFQDQGSVGSINSIFASSTGAGCTRDGSSLFGSPEGCGLGAFNGSYYPLLADSLAIDTGEPDCPDTDQIGNPRRVDGDGGGEGQCDIGAIEYQRYLVDTVSDENRAGACATPSLADGDCSLREAVLLANFTPGHQTIDVPAGVYDLTIPSGSEDPGGEDASVGDLDLKDDVTIIGVGEGVAVIDAGEQHRVFHVMGNVPVRMERLTVQNGRSNNGGGMSTNGDTTLVNMTFSGNYADMGGAINLNRGDLTLINCTLKDNGSAGGDGIYRYGTLTIHNTLIANPGYTADCQGQGQISVNDHNLIEDNTCNPPLSGDPHLGAYTDGYYAPQVGSIAIDAGNPDTCAETDQLGQSRTDGNGDGSAICDIGAIEYQITPPVADAGGPYAGDEGGVYYLDGSASTGAGITEYAWDCRDDGSYDVTSASPTGSACIYPDNGSYVLRLRVTDAFNQTDEDTADVTINNVAPQATFGYPTINVNEGANFTLTFTNPSDPSSTDTAAGFTYAFDCGDGYGAFAAANSILCPTSDNGSRAVKGNIRDKDGGEREYSGTVTVKNLAPTATFSHNGPVVAGNNLILTLSNPVDAPGDVTAGFTYAFDCGDGAGYGAWSGTATRSCPTSASGSRTVRGKIRDKDLSATAYTATAQVTPPTTGVIFADSFESGNLSAWSGAVTGGGDLSVSAGAAMKGTKGMQATINDNTSLYVKDTRPASEVRYNARFYFDPNSIVMTSGDMHYIFTGRMGTVDVLRVTFRRYTTTYQVRVQIRTDAATYTSGTWYTITDGPHAIEIEWKAATGAGANNGSIALWLDGALKQTKAGIDNDTLRVDEVRLGPLAGIDAGTRGVTYFDAFESRRTGYIGLATAAGVPPAEEADTGMEDESTEDVSDDEPQLYLPLMQQ